MPRLLINAKYVSSKQSVEVETTRNMREKLVSFSPAACFTNKPSRRGTLFERVRGFLLAENASNLHYAARNVWSGAQKPNLFGGIFLGSLFFYYEGINRLVSILISKLRLITLRSVKVNVRRLRNTRTLLLRWLPSLCCFGTAQAESHWIHQHLTQPKGYLNTSAGGTQVLGIPGACRFIYCLHSPHQSTPIVQLCKLHCAGSEWHGTIPKLQAFTHP